MELTGWDLVANLRRTIEVDLADTRRVRVEQRASAIGRVDVDVDEEHDRARRSSSQPPPDPLVGPWSPAVARMRLI